MSPREYSISRLDAVLEEIGRLKEVEFPYQHSRDALARIEKVFIKHRDRLKGLPPGKIPAIVDHLCSIALTDLFRYLPLLGFVLRSTNVRNAFEVYGPVLRLSQQVLGPDTKLIISSEWEQSPFTLREISELPNFVLIGFPAPESSNPLLIPLAGHELGHTVWRARSYASEYAQAIEEKIMAEIERRLKEYEELYPNQNAVKGEVQSNIFVKQTVALPAQWAMKQCEEHFCDFVGLYLFEEAYLHAFAYLLSPRAGGQRSVHYPTTVRRVEKMVEAAGKYRAKVGDGFKISPEYATLFQEVAEVPDKERHRKFLLSLADAASGALAAELMHKAETVLLAAKVGVLSTAEKGRILDSFKIVVPAVSTQSLTNILNAAWDVYHDEKFWSHVPQIRNPHRVLKEVVLKNIEVLEIEQILQDQP